MRAGAIPPPVVVAAPAPAAGRATGSAKIEQVSMGAVPASSPRPARPAAPHGAGPAQPPRAPGATLPLAASNRAVLITGDASKTSVFLGADGKLPELVLHEGSQREKNVEKSATQSPLVLIGVLAFSVGLSMLMLLADTTPQRADTRTKAEARRVLRNHYLADQSPLEPYQVVLREALQAYSRGDFVAERRLYRRVLDMLHEEGKNKHAGLTGALYGALPPSDQDLENQLSILLRED